MGNPDFYFLLWKGSQDSPNSYQLKHSGNWGNPCQPFKNKTVDKDSPWSTIWK